MSVKDRLTEEKCGLPSCDNRLTAWQVRKGIICCCYAHGQQMRHGGKKIWKPTKADVAYEKKAPPMKADLDALLSMRVNREIREIMAEETGRKGYQRPRGGRSFRERYRFLPERLTG